MLNIQASVVNLEIDLNDLKKEILDKQLEWANII